MPLPNYEAFMEPLLRLLKDGRTYSSRETFDAIAKAMDLDEADLAAQLPSGRQGVYANRLGWARTYLKMAGLIEAPKRGTYRITPRGLKALANDAGSIDGAYLDRFPEFQAFKQRRHTDGGSDAEAGTDTATDAGTDQATPVPPSAQTPEESLEQAYQNLRAALATELLGQIQQASPTFFENLVVDLLVAMGYGGSRADAGQALGRSGDEGIDGVIKEDKLGLDVIYLQAKRWTGTVGRPEIQKFAGALQGQRARKGIFITTSAFTRDALDYASRIDTKIILIDGTRLAQLLIDHDVGVSASATYSIKRLDADYFTEG